MITETIDLSCVFKVDKKNKKILQKVLKVFKSYEITLIEKDTINFTYVLDINYMNNVKEKLELLCKIWGIAKNKKVNFKKLKKTKICGLTIYKLCNKLCSLL